MKRIELLILVILCGVFYTATNYGGVRSSDSEIVFRSAQALADTGHFAVAQELESWPKFGLAIGRDGKQYSVFGPLQPIVEAPVVALGERLSATHWYDNTPFTFPLSLYIANGTEYLSRHARPPDLAPHALRFLVGFLNIIFSTLAVVVFYLFLLRLGLERFPSFFTAIVFAFGTLLWPYAGTCMSEPLSTLLVVISLYYLAPGSNAAHRTRDLALSGLAIGLATCTHISAALFAPFFLGYALLQARQTEKSGAWRALLAFSAGLFIPLALLGCHNFARFGNPLETGRFADPARAAELHYGISVAPWEGLLGLLFSPGKGLLFYCPAMVLGILGFRRFIRAHRLLALTLASAAIFRLLFIASRSDWSGGTCLGPRFLVMGLPLVIAPIGYLVQHLMTRRDKLPLAGVFAVSFAAIAQQLYFALGEIFIFTAAVLGTLERQVDMGLLAPDAPVRLLFSTWEISPLLHLLRVMGPYGMQDAPRGPFLLKDLPLSNTALWFLGVMIIWLILALVLYRQSRAPQPAPVKQQAPEPQRHKGTKARKKVKP